METDIVYELRSLEVRTDVAYHGDEVRLFNSTMRAAADEIERLRTQGNGLADRVNSLLAEQQDLYRHIATKEPWIPVSERLPEERELVLWIRPADKFWPYVVGRREGDTINWGGEMNMGIEPFVTHWLSMPAPPAQ